MTAPPLYLIRHTAVVPVDALPPHEWLPSEAGLAAARRLAAAPVWRTLAGVATSTEPKAVATAEPIAAAAGVPLREEDGLREAARPAAVLDAEQHQERVRRYLEGEPVAGWEPRDDARDRFQRCIDHLLADATGSIAVVSHGTVLALYLGLAYDDWAAIPLPAVAVADPSPPPCLIERFRSVDEVLGVNPRGPG